MQSIEKQYDIKHILTFGGIVAVAIAGSYLIRSYLDILRIQALRKGLYKQNIMYNE